MLTYYYLNGEQVVVKFHWDNIHEDMIITEILYKGIDVKKIVNDNDYSVIIEYLYEIKDKI